MADYKLLKGDASLAMGDMYPSSVDLIVTDPPYASLEKHRKVGTTTRLTKQWFPTVPNDYFLRFFRYAYVALKKDSHCYVFCDQETMFHIVPMARAAGFTFWKPLIWDKMLIGMGYHYRSQYECILFFEKGKRKLNNLGIPDVLREKRLLGKQYYPTEKPVPLLRTLIAQSSSPEDLVLDPFMGSGSTLQAALELNRRTWGIDALLDTVKRVRARLEALEGHQEI